MTGIVRWLDGTAPRMAITLRRQVNRDRHCIQGDHCTFEWSRANVVDAQAEQEWYRDRPWIFPDPLYPLEISRLMGTPRLPFCVDMTVRVSI